MYRTNIASQAVFTQMNSRVDGSPLTTSVTAKVVTGAAGTYEDGAGTLTHMGGGMWRYAPTQGETNAPVLAVQFNHATGVNATLTMLTTAADPSSVTRGLAGTALPASAADAAGGLPISDAGGLDLDTKLANTNEVTAARMATLTDWINGGRLDLILDIIAADTTTDIPTLIATLQAFVDTEVGAIKTQTDKLTFTVANQIDANVLDWKSAVAPAMTGDAFARLGAPAGASVSVDVAAVKTQTAAIEVDTAVIGALGAGLTAIPWNASWDAQVESEVNDALVVHRLDELLNADSDIDGAAPPTVGSVIHEMLSKTAGSFTFDQTTDSLEAIRDKETDIETDTAVIGALGAGLTAADDATLAAIAALNNLSAAQVNAEVDAALVDIHLDHLLAAAYDPAAKPGAADALLNELVESDAGVSRYTANALEQAPSGTGASAASIRAEIDANSTQLAAIVGDTNELQTDWANGGRLDLILDTAALGGSGGLDAAGVRAAVGLASANLDTQLGDIPTNAELNTSQAASDDATLAAIAALNNVSTTQVNAEVDQALADYDAPTRTELTADINSVLSKMLKYVQLIVRKDAAVGTDNAAEKTAINASGGSGAGVFDQTTDSQEAIRDKVTDTDTFLTVIEQEVADIQSPIISTQIVVDQVLAAVAALNNIAPGAAMTLTSGAQLAIADAIAGRSLGAESYAAVGTVPTFAQALLELLAIGGEVSISGTTLTNMRRNGLTPALTAALALNEEGEATARTRIT